MNKNEKKPEEVKKSLTHSEMMQFLHTTLSKKNKNVTAEKKLAKSNNSENMIEVVFLKKSQRETLN